VTATRAEPIRSLPAAELGRRVEAYARSASLEIEVAVEEDPEVAARSARARLEAGKRLCATGSVYLAGVARRVLGADARGEEPPAGGEPGTHLVELEYAIAPACEADLRAIPDLERRAATLFSYEDLPPEIAEEVHSLDELRAAQREGRLLVARSQTSDPLRASEAAPLGFALLRMLDGHAHLEEIDVDPEYARRGIGQRLVASACAWAFDAGAPAITLSTFRDVAWNAPFYARLGFETVPEAEYGDAVRALRESERAQGLPVERRVIMRRPIGPEDRVSAAPFRTRAAPR
jgi:ribosomal protein S18 acetylase RimI-like enzyme